MNIDLDFNPADFQIYDEFGLDLDLIFCLTTFGF